MKEDRTPNFEYYTKKIADWEGSQDIKDDLTWGMDVCKDFSMCISPKRAKSPFMKELGHMISFMKCMEMKKMQACMKSDMKKYAAKNGIDNFDLMFDNGFLMGMKDNKKEKMGINGLTATMSGDLLF